jgi:hypothetical protein
MQNQKVKKARPGSTGSKHWNFKSGNETLAAKKKRSETSLRLHYLSQIGHELGFMNGRRMVGRRPNNYMKLNFNNPLHIFYAVSKIDNK